MAPWSVQVLEKMKNLTKADALEVAAAAEDHDSDSDDTSSADGTSSDGANNSKKNNATAKQAGADGAAAGSGAGGASDGAPDVDDLPLGEFFVTTLSDGANAVFSGVCVRPRVGVCLLYLNLNAVCG